MDEVFWISADVLVVAIAVATAIFWMKNADTENSASVGKSINNEIKRVGWEGWLTRYEKFRSLLLNSATSSFIWSAAYGSEQFKYAEEEHRGWWDRTFSQETVEAGAKKIDISHVGALKFVDFQSIENDIRERLEFIDGEGGKFPSWEGHYPRNPVLLDVEKILSSYKFNSKDQQSVRVRCAELNERLVSAYDLACSECKDMRDEYELAWHSSKNEERDFILALISPEVGVERLTSFVLQAIPFHNWMPREFGVRYDRVSKILIIEHEFVDVETVQWIKWVDLKQSKSEKAANKSEIKTAENALYPVISMVIALSVAKKLLLPDVDSIVVNGWVNHRSKTTGVALITYCTSLIAPVEKLRQIEWVHADPSAAFSSLKGNVSRSLEFNPIAPPVRLDVSDARFVDAREILSNMSDGENLASMDWDDFEHLCRELFERVFASNGATVSVTQASRDQGVDAIINDPDPIKGGKIVIQAKRYVNTVDVSAVRDLWGTVSHEGAMKGLLVTTSQFGPDSYSFSKDKPITLINGSELLYLLEQNGYKFRIDLEEARKLQKESGTSPFHRSGQRST